MKLNKFKLFLNILLLSVNISFLNASTLTVTYSGEGNTTDGVSLRWAITQANNNIGPDLINFNLGSGVTSIMLTSPLPAITDSYTTINGFDNGANSGTANTIGVHNLTSTNFLNASYRIMLYNSSANIAQGLVINSNNNSINGLIIPNFGDGTLSDNDIGILISGNTNSVTGCYIGMLPDGVTKGGFNTASGIVIRGTNNFVGNGLASGVNLISGMNNYSGIKVVGAISSGNVIKGNVIGLQKNGSTAVVGANQNYGILLTDTSSNTTIGGTNASNMNIISGNAMKGIFLSNTSGNNIQNNMVGPQIDGSVVTSNTQIEGIHISNSANTTIGGNYFTFRNIISANLQYGVHISGIGSTGNFVRANYIGTHKFGNQVITNNTQDYGVFIEDNASGNIIGGNNNGESNLISANTNSGIMLTSQAAAGNTIVGNIIGTQYDGKTNLTGNTQSHGIYMMNSLNNVIGSSAAYGRNIISANLQNGIYITGNSATGNQVRNNYLGCSMTTSVTIVGASQDYGVNLDSLSSLNMIGSSISGEGNLISGNTIAGIYFNSKHNSGNICKGNSIGYLGGFTSNNPQYYGIWIENSPNNVIGGSGSFERNNIFNSLSLGTADKGIYINGTNSSNTTIHNNFIIGQDFGIYVNTATAINTIGGSGSNEGNVISCNSLYGIYYHNCSGANQVKGNIIGLEINGIDQAYYGPTAQPNGIGIRNSQNIIIGGTSTGDRNIISGNTSAGILITSATSSLNTVIGNYIGCTKDGTAAVTSSNQDYGIRIDSALNNTIGGYGANEGNLISGNMLGNFTFASGIYLVNNAQNNVIIGNIIGPQKNGLSQLVGSTQSCGVLIDQAKNNIIGNTISNGKNIISSNQNNGVIIQGSNSTGNIVKGNYLGIAADGTSFININLQQVGVGLASGALNNTIGGAAPGEGNLISGNSYRGIQLLTYSHDNTIIGNIIGTDINNAYISNFQHQTYGIEIIQSQNNTIGGNTPGARNIISGNRPYPTSGIQTNAGIYMYGAYTTGNTIKGNYIGIASDGMNYLTSSDQPYGIHMFLANNNTVGGANAGDGNLISGNSVRGIFLENNAHSNLIIGNTIGTQKSGDTIVNSTTGERQDYGIYIKDSPNNTIGGMTPNSSNTISGNIYGVYIIGIPSKFNKIKGNYIGGASDGISPLSSNFQLAGIFIYGCDSNFVGGRTSNERNILSYNNSAGIVVNNYGSATARCNKISCNLIFGNPYYSISLNNSGNNAKPSPVILSSYPDSIIGTSAPLDTIEIFKNTINNCLDAKMYVGFTKADAAGNWAFASSFNLGDNIMVNGTAADNNTSEFACATISCPSVNIIGNTVLCNGASTSLTASGGVSYVWGPETFTTSTASFSVAGTKTLTTTYGSSCITTTTINVTDLTLGTPGNIDGPLNICQGQAGLSYSVPAITNATSYSWSLPAGATISSGINTNSITVNYSSIATSGNITVIGNNSCGNSSASNSFSVVANPLPNITISGNSTICNGDTVILTASGASTYSWSAGSSVSTQTFTPSSNTTVSITGTDSNNCANTATINVSVNSLPNLTISGASSVCNGNSLILTANGASTYSWSSGSSLSTVTLTPTSNTTYSITGTDSNGCTNTTVTSITVNPLPDVSITSAANSINANQNGATYQWVDCNNNFSIIASETNQSYITNISGDYAVIVTNNGCTDTSLCANILITTMSETNELNNITLFPNPLISHTTILFSESQKNVTIKIVDLLGKNLRTINFTGKNCVIEKENIPAGTYFLEIKTENGVFYKKIIVGV